MVFERGILAARLRNAIFETDCSYAVAGADLRGADLFCSSHLEGRCWQMLSMTTTPGRSFKNHQCKLVEELTAWHINDVSAYYPCDASNPDSPLTRA